MNELYLSRIKLDPAKKDTLRALAAPGKFHGALEASFNGPRQRNLWRLDSLNGALYILLLSKTAPDLSHVCAQFCCSSEDVQTKQYDGLLSHVECGTRWRFRLTANPVKAQMQDQGRGKVQACTTIPQQEMWLLAHCEKHGFRVTEDSFQVMQNKWYRFYKSDRNQVSLLAVTYEGELEITDAELFRTALCSGVGRGKAYGMGLLTVIRTQEVGNV